jgi:hypothetical protein
LTVLERFRAKWIPVRVKKTRQNKRLEPGSDSIRTGKALVQRIAVSANIGRMRTLRGIFVAVVLAARIGVPVTADASSVRSMGAYDGTWNVVFATRTGNCSSSNSVPFAVSGARVSSAGGGKVTGGISRVGVVSVRISVGLSVASGSGKLVGDSGSGRWSGIISGDKCSGSWQATRS